MWFPPLLWIPKSEMVENQLEDLSDLYSGDKLISLITSFPKGLLSVFNV